MGLGTVVAIGWRAAAALDHSAVARILAPMRSSIYVVAAGEILWLGGPGDTMHPRAILLSAPPDFSACAAGDALSLPRYVGPVWRPRTPTITAEAAGALRRGGAVLTKTAAAIGEAVGLGAWLAQRPLDFPLTGAGTLADTLARACASDDAVAAAEAAVHLLGMGAGLTPSGDDFVGGAFFARATLAALGGTDGERWRGAATAVRMAAAASTTPISAALLGDLLDGHGWAPLHDLAAALAAGDAAAVETHVRGLTRLGHSSGWDVLAGFAAGAR